MNMNEIRKLAEMDVEAAAIDSFEIMFCGLPQVPEEYKKSCIEETLMPMIQKHKDMATELLSIREGLDRMAKKLEDAANGVAKPDPANG